MTQQIQISSGAALLGELLEFASFPAETRSFIRRSLELCFGGPGAGLRRARSQQEAYEIQAQAQVYAGLDFVRQRLPGEGEVGDLETFFPALVAITDFDIGLGQLRSFGAYRFLYERLLGAAARRWLPSAFCAAAAMPHLQVANGARLLASVGDAPAARWSRRQPSFYPEWDECVTCI